MKILVAEDEPAIAESYKLILLHGGHDVVMTNDGAECVEVFTQHHYDSVKNNPTSSAGPFDIVILDYRMPKKDGVQAANEIRTLAPLQRILLATAYAHDLSIATLHQSPKTQSVEILQKPFEFDQFLRIIEGHNEQQLKASPLTVQTNAALHEDDSFAARVEHSLDSSGLGFGDSTDALSMRVLDLQGMNTQT